MAPAKRAIDTHSLLSSRVGGLLGLGLMLGLGACGGDDSAAGPPAAPVTKAEVNGASPWMMPPSVKTVDRDGADLVVSGLGDPGGRVVLRTPVGRAYAAVADARGVFAVRLSAADGLVLTPEAQLGQDTVPAAGRLVILDSQAGTAVTLSPGEASRRLGPAPVLAAVDHDGRAVILSGRSDPDSTVRIDMPGRGPLQVRAESSGIWRVTLDGGVPSEVQVNGQAFALPGLVTAGASGVTSAVAVLTRDDGYLLQWQAPDGAPQTTWLPRR